MISIIMSTYNSEDTLSEAIESILIQTFKDFEFLIMNDGSNDGTDEILNHYLKKDARIKIFKNTNNIGLTKSLNYLVNKSKYEIIARQDSDDLSHKQRLEKQYNLLNSTVFSICTTRSQSIQTRKKIPNLSFYLPIKLLLKFKNPFVHGTLMMSKKILLDVGCYDEDYKYAQDYKLMLDLYRSGNKVKIINEVLYYLNTKDNISSNNSHEQKFFFNKARKAKN
jgi:glycosyltransferase involved in cell wall biosynthesis